MRRLAGAPAVLPLLGRDNEMEQLGAALEDARSGRGRLVLIAGEAGIGKSRLIEAFVQPTWATEVRAVWGHCWEAGGAPPFWPWIQLLQASIAELPSEALLRHVSPWGPDIAQLVPDLVGRVPGLVLTASSESPDARLRLFGSVIGFLRDVAADGGLVVVLEDLHAADDASLRLLEHLAAEAVGDSQLLVVGSYRDAEARSSVRLHRRLAAIARHGRRLVLNGLDEESIRELWNAVTGEEPAGEVLRRVYDITDGNPFFVQETGHLLRSQTGRSIVLGQVPLSEEAAGVIRRRLDPMGDRAREVLGQAAVLGKEFDLAMLSALSGHPVGEALDILAPARSARFVDEVALGRWAFEHGQIREVLYDDLSASQRVELHRRAGEALERGGGAGAGQHPAELAHHFFEAARAGDASKAISYCTLAGDAAMATLAFEEATLQYSRALEALALTKPTAEHQRYELLVALGEAERRGGRFPEAREFYRRALKAARFIGSPDLLARAAVGYAGLPESAVDETRASVVQEADAALPDEDSALKARLLLAGATTSDGDVGRRRSRRALDMARRVGDPRTLREVLLQWHLLNQGSDLLEERRAVADELIQLAGEAGDRERLAVARQWRAWDLAEAADIDGMRVDLELARQEADALRLPFLIWGVTFMRAGLALLDFQLEEAERLAREAMAAGERSELADVEGVLLWQLCSIRREEGRFEEMADLARRASQVSRGLWTGTDRLPLALALALAEQGRADEARRELETVVDQVLDGDPGWVAMLIDTCWLLGETRWAQPCYDRLVTIPHRHLTLGVAIASYGSSDRYLAQAATLLGGYDDAETHFLAAHAMHQRMGAPSWIARGQVDHARMLRLRNQAGDRARADDLLRQAGERYRALGMAAHAARLGELAGPGRAPGASASERAAFRSEGEYWAVDYAGSQVRLRNSKGLGHLARLLANPGQEVHVLDLVVGLSAQRGRSGAASRSGGLVAGRGGDARAVLDPKAKAAYRRRITELRADIEEAEAYNDLGRADRAQQELDFLLSELSSALGVGGRDRRASSDAERARQSATRAIRSAIDRIADGHPPLGEHLRTTVRTGLYCAYAPDPRAPIVWEI